APRGYGATTAMVALASMKQYLVVPAALYVATRPRLRAIAAGVGIAALVAAPFFVWDSASLMRWGFRFNLTQTAVRSDSMTLTALAAPWLHGGWWGPLPAFIAPIVVGVAAHFRFRRTGLTRAMLASIAALTTGFLLAWQGFVNYYVAIGAMALVAATSA